MVPWKTDAVYRRIFGEIMDLWRGLDPGDRPLAMRVEEHASPRWGRLADRASILNTWVVDDAGPRLFQGLRREAYVPGGRRGRCSQFGLIRFHIDPLAGRVAFACLLGPDLGEDRLFSVEPTEEAASTLAVENLRELPRPAVASDPCEVG